MEGSYQCIVLLFIWLTACLCTDGLKLNLCVSQFSVDNLLPCEGHGEPFPILTAKCLYHSAGDEDEQGVRKDKKRVRRSRSRERRRSRSRERKRSRRSRSKERRRKGERGEGDEFTTEGTIKTEKTEDDYLYGGPDFRQQESNGMDNIDHSMHNENDQPPSEEYDTKVFISKPVEDEFPAA